VQLIDGQVVCSATDLVGFLACEHLTNLERAATAGLVRRPMRDDPEIDVVAKRGFAHEQRFLEGLRAAGRQITVIRLDGSGAPDGSALRAAAEETAAALRRGDEVVYQATFFDGRWRGHADFLIRVETPSDLGPWSYEVWDTKLARRTKGSALIQMGLYSELLADLQGLRPESMHVALGGSARRVESHRVADYAAYFRMVRRQFEEFVAAGEPEFPPRTRPDPVEHCEVCRWSVDCQKARRRADDLSLVAGITGRQRRGLRKHAVTTRRGLGGLQLPLLWQIDGVHADTLAKIHDQARLQVEGQAQDRVLYELLVPRGVSTGEIEPNLGLLSLPEPSPGDLFFDIEGDPYALYDGVDYLFGVLEPGLLDEHGQPTFHAFWSRDAIGDVTLAAEKQAFESLVDFFVARLERDPNLHIYHYAPYEPTAVGRLMGRYNTREAEIDRFMRGQVFVDLYRAVRQGIRASVESYSIKKLEPLYEFTRTIDLRDAGSSIVAFEAWLELDEDTNRDSAILDRIEGYNRDDCVSTWKLRDWLEGRRPELAEHIGMDIPRPIALDPNPSDELAGTLARVRATEERLSADVPVAEGERTAEEQARWLLAQLLSWHRRESKQSWWRWFFLLNKLTDQERIEEPEPIGGLTYVGAVGQEKKSVIHRYRFPAQEHDVSIGHGVTDPATKGSPGTVVDLDPAAGTIDLKRSIGSSAAHPTSLVPDLVVPGRAQQESLLRIGEWVADHPIEAPGPFRSTRDLLLRRAPSGASIGAAAGPVVNEGESPAEAASRIVMELGEHALAIQGPPGSGKSTIGAEMIVDLVAAGRRVGVTANGHRVIGSLLDKVVAAGARRGVTVRVGQKPGGRGESCTCTTARELSTNEAVHDALVAHEVDVVGGTTWLWARPELAGLVDVLFIDEAGQMALANAVAVAPAADGLVLLGDPQQLDQPLQGSHPPGADRSALGHLLGPHATMPPDLGLFLERTWRLHPDICDYTSEVFYDGRLVSEPGRERQELLGIAPLDGVGIAFLPVVHAGNDNDSDEEASQIAEWVDRLIRGRPTWRDADGTERAVGLEDVLVITPYNAQVRTIGAELPGARVGTVDKFQGQEAPIAIYSMATSAAEDAPRGIEFLYSLNRLNVATSRARCLAVVVASPELLRVRCRTPHQMLLANALARLVEVAAEQAERRDAAISVNSPEPSPA